MMKNSPEMRIPLKITINGDETAELEIPKKRFTLKKGSYSEWVNLIFHPGLRLKVSGICRFFIKQISPNFEMYLTPINIDPEKPSLPISYPFSYSVYLSKMIGSYATLGLAEDTWALNERIIDEDAFLEQVYNNHSEREKMFFNALDKTKKGLCVCVFDATDRIQHMFMRFVSDNHPSHKNGVNKEKYKNVIEDLYKRMDSLVGKVMNTIDDKNVLMVISDHGFKLFNRGVNLNTWLYKNGYLTLKNNKETGGEWFKDIDWENTLAYTFGLSGIYINEAGRESKGIVSSKEKDKLKTVLKEKLEGLKDEKCNKIAINKVYNSSECYDGPYIENGPDLVIGYNEGYRASWGAAVGKVEKNVFEDNVKSWSGDHCMDPKLVPGIFFCNHRIRRDILHIGDIGPTVLKWFGVEVPTNMTGKPLID
jgi:predicted AlkP superfamily phosphohydrolase/phosphomutase